MTDVIIAKIFPVLGISCMRDALSEHLGTLGTTCRRLRIIGYIPGIHVIAGLALALIGKKAADMEKQGEINEHKWTRIVIYNDIHDRGIATALFGPLLLLADLVISAIARSGVLYCGTG